jgi:hypothetical protein
MKFLKNNLFVIIFLLVIIISDLLLTYNNFIAKSDYFVKNDFEITQSKHPERVWDKVFFGNSVVISGFIEEQSTSGYINLGLDYGVVTDLWDMLRKHEINVGSELVIGLNYLTLYDNFETNPTYIWHKKWYQPYAYFERDRFYPIITDGFSNLLNGKSPLPYKYAEQEKSVYHGMVAEQAMLDKLEEYDEKYFNLPLSEFSENMKALEKIIKYCNRHNIRVRAVWMPWNTKYEMPTLLKNVKQKTNDILVKYNIETLDLETEIPSEYFYDSGHLNYDIGAPRFTERLDLWL